MEKLVVTVQAEGWSQALPGLYLEVSMHQPSRPNIRGLASEFNLITFDGVRIGNTNNDRADGVSGYPAESLARVELIKSVTPDMEGGATGGINFLSRRVLANATPQVPARDQHQFTLPDATKP